MRPCLRESLLFSSCKAFAPLDRDLEIVLLFTQAAYKAGEMFAISFCGRDYSQIVYLVLVLSFASSILTTSTNTSVCTSDLDSANVTGTTLINDDYLYNGATGYYARPADIGVLIDEPMNTTAYGDGYNISYSVAFSNSTLSPTGQYQDPVLETAIWTGQPPSINLYSGANFFSACAIVFSALPLNTIRLGQSDDGSCAQTLSTACVTKLRAKLALFAQYQVADPLGFGSDNNNLTNADGSSVLPQICNNIAADVGGWAGGDASASNAIPEECQPYMYDKTLSKFTGPPVQGYRMFDHLDTCQLQSPRN